MDRQDTRATTRDPVSVNAGGAADADLTKPEQAGTASGE